MPDDNQQLAHIVFFTLKDKSPAAVDKLLAACHQFLTGHSGTLYFSAGTRVPDLSREVNDDQFDVSLHVVFADRASHDRYQADARHLEFIEQNRGNWQQVRVFDSYANGVDSTT